MCLRTPLKCNIRPSRRWAGGRLWRVGLRTGWRRSWSAGRRLACRCCSRSPGWSRSLATEESTLSGSTRSRLGCAWLGSRPRSLDSPRLTPLATCCSTFRRPRPSRSSCWYILHRNASTHLACSSIAVQSDPLPPLLGDCRDVERDSPSSAAQHTPLCEHGRGGPSADLPVVQASAAVVADRDVLRVAEPLVLSVHGPGATVTVRPAGFQVQGPVTCHSAAKYAPFSTLSALSAVSALSALTVLTALPAPMDLHRSSSQPMGSGSARHWLGSPPPKRNTRLWCWPSRRPKNRRRAQSQKSHRRATGTTCMAERGRSIGKPGR